MLVGRSKSLLEIGRFESKEFLSTHVMWKRISKDVLLIGVIILRGLLRRRVAAVTLESEGPSTQHQQATHINTKVSASVEFRRGSSVADLRAIFSIISVILCGFLKFVPGGC